MNKKTMRLVAMSAMVLFLLLGVARAGTVVIQCEVLASPGNPLVDMQRNWARLVEEASGGTLKMELYHSGQLGKQAEMFDQMFAGAPVICLGTPPFFADLGVPDFGIAQAPYLCRNWDEVRKLRNSDWWREQEEQLAQMGYRVLAFDIEYGSRNTLSRRQLKVPGDFDGLKIRVPSSNFYVKMFDAMDSAPTPMALSEVYTALQQGTIDAVENPPVTMASERHYEVAKYLLLDGHIIDLQCWVTSSEFFDTLSPEHQKILVETCKQACAEFNRSARKAEADALRQMRDSGVIVTEVADFEAFRKAVEKFYSYPEFTGSWSPGLHEKIKAILAE